MPKIINVNLMKSPVNWVKIFLMAVFAFTAFFLIADIIVPKDRAE